MEPSSRRSGKFTRSMLLHALMTSVRSLGTRATFVALSKFSFTISRKRGSAPSVTTGPKSDAAACPDDARANANRAVGAERRRIANMAL
jgi:hypothetical protein